MDDLGMLPGIICVSNHGRSGSQQGGAFYKFPARILSLVWRHILFALEVLTVKIRQVFDVLTEPIKVNSPK